MCEPPEAFLIQTPTAREFLSATKNKVTSLAGKWISWKVIVLRKLNQSQQARNMFSFIYVGLRFHLLIQNYICACGIRVDTEQLGAKAGVG